MDSERAPEHMTANIPPVPRPARRLQRERTLTTLSAAVAFVVVLIAWQTVGMEGILYPIRLFVTLIHELGHGLAAIISGGEFRNFVVNANGSGVATTAGGSRWLILPAGYLGAALFGAILLVLTNRLTATRAIAVGVSLLVAGCVILFSGANSTALVVLLVGTGAAYLAGDHFRRVRTPLFIAAGLGGVLLVILIWNTTALKVGIGMAVVLALAGLILPRLALGFVLNFLALIVGLNAIMDVWFLLGNMGASVGTVNNDAAAMGEFSNTPGQLWAVLWVFLAAVMMLSAAYVAFVQPVRRREG